MAAGVTKRLKIRNLGFAFRMVAVENFLSTNDCVNASLFASVGGWAGRLLWQRTHA
jgi:hypothetical protein